MIAQRSKRWKDAQGRYWYRLGDLPNNIDFKLAGDGVVYKTYTHPRSSHTGKRQCMNTVNGKVQYIFCSKKVLVSDYSEN